MEKITKEEKKKFKKINKKIMKEVAKFQKDGVIENKGYPSGIVYTKFSKINTNFGIKTFIENRKLFEWLKNN